MTEREQREREERVLVVMPTQKDAAMAEAVLRGVGVACVVCADLPGACRELARGAGAVVLAEQVLVPGESEELLGWLANQQVWSDLPVLVLGHGGSGGGARCCAGSTASYSCRNRWRSKRC